MSINEKGIGWVDIINFPCTTLGTLHLAHEGIDKPKSQIQNPGRKKVLTRITSSCPHHVQNCRFVQFQMNFRRMIFIFIYQANKLYFVVNEANPGIKFR